MKISIYLDKRRQNADGSYGVYFRITAYDKKRFVLHSGMTARFDLIGEEFDGLELRSKAKTLSLKNKLSMVEQYCMLHPCMGADELKAGLSEMLTGVPYTERKKGRPLLPCFEEYTKTQDIKPQTAGLYMLSARTLLEFDSTATLESITPEWLESYFRYRTALGRKINGIGRTLRDLKAVYNYCRKKGYTQNYPFADYTIKREQTRHKNLHVDRLRKLLAYPCEEFQVRYRDIFELSIYLWGINIGDLLLLRKEDYHDGYIYYDRNKTGKSIRIKVTERAKVIIERYKGEKYLLEFMDNRADYHSYLSQSNEALKSIGKTFAAGKKTTGEALMPELSSNYARHTVSTLAAEIGVQMTTVSMSLGHTMKGGAAVTATYVEFQQWMVDDAIEDIIDYIHSGKDAKTWMRDRKLKDSGIQQMMSEMLKQLQLQQIV